MKAFDLSYLYRKFLNTIWRFPLIIILIVLAFTSSIFVIFKDNGTDIWLHLMLSSIIGIPLFLGINLYLERVETQRWFNIILNLFGFLILFVFFISLPSHNIYGKHFIRTFVLFISFFASMFYLPFIGFDQQMPFWYYNYTFIKRIILSSFFALVFYLGINIALMALNMLFEVKIDYKWFLFIASLSFVLFLPWFILGGLQRKFTYHAQKNYFPKELRTFAIYVLAPINSLYAVILLVYIAKIAITGIWPSGWTVSLIIGYSVIELLIIILTYPIIYDKENKMVVKYIYLNLILSVLFFVIYFLAIIKRTSEYGLTESRIYVYIYGVWFLFLVAYILFRKIKDIRIIPFSLFVVAFLSVSGSWNVFRICKNQQLKRLDNILQKNDLIENGKINAKDKTIDLKTEAEISSIALYLVEIHGSNTIHKYFKMNVDSLFNANDSLNNHTFAKMVKLFSSVGLSFNPYYYDNSKYPYVEFYTQERREYFSVDSSLYACILNVYSYEGASEYKNSLKLNDSIKVDLSLSNKDGILHIYINDKPDASINLMEYFKLLNSLKPLEKNSNATMLLASDLKTSISGLKYNYEFLFERMEYVIKEKKEAPVSATGYMLIKKKW